MRRGDVCSSCTNRCNIGAVFRVRGKEILKRSSHDHISGTKVSLPNANS